MAKGVPIHKLALPGQPLRESASVLTVRWNEMAAWAETIHDPTNVVGLHNMRIAAKRLRYTLEIFAPVLNGSGGSDLMRTMEELQERIGAIHDCDILFPLLQATIAREMKRERKEVARRVAGPPPFLAAEGLIALMTRKRAERETRYAEFVHWWDSLPPQKLGDSLERAINAASSNTRTDGKSAASEDN